MPRPRRARRAPAQPVKPSISTAALENESASDSDGPRPAAEEVRGRKRTTRSMGTRLSLDDQEAILAAERSRDAALDRLADEDPTTTSGNAAEEDEDSPASIELGRRVPSPLAQERDITGLDLADEDVFGDLDDSFEGGGVPQGIDSTEVSSLNLSNFKRRPRKSSIISRNDPPIRPSSRGGTTPSISSTLNLGVFRRRAREPSILGTARKPRAEETITLSSDPESSDEEDFAPDAESTPLNQRRQTRPASDSEFDSDTLQDITSKSKSRKRKSEDATLSSDRPEKVSRLEDDEEDEDEEVEDEENLREEREVLADEVPSDSESSLSSLSSPRGPPPVLPERPVTPFQDEEIMAPPASSGSEDDYVLPDIHGLAKRRRRPSATTPVRANDQLSDISSPPSLTHSPNYEDTRKTRGRPARRQASPKMTTADLTNMLPKRKYKKKRDEFDLESDGELDASGLGRDEDELSYLDTRTARRGKGSRPPSRGTARPGSRGGRGAPTALKPRQTPASAQTTRRNGKTYSRRSSDKENEGEDHDDDDDDEEHERSRFRPLPEDSFDSAANESSSTPSADELKQAAKKFKEVDRWELEFEEITQSSSPPNAR